MGSCGRTRWPARPGRLVLGLGLDYKSLSKERTGSCHESGVLQHRTVSLF